MKLMQIPTILLAALLFTPMGVAQDDDSSADLRGGFANAIRQTQGVMIRVPVNAAGEEQSNLAEMRAYSGDHEVADASDANTAWAESRDIRTLPGGAAAVDVERDSSTFFCHYWRGRGWVTPYWYATYYTPVVTYGSVTYTYTQPVYYTYYAPVVYSGYSYWGYRYYYYSSSWY